MDHDREAQMLRAAQLYYYENLTQGAIADWMNCTRWTVGRLLDEARACGIVAISINHPRSRVPALEKRLIEAFGLGEAIVVRQQSTPAGTLELVAAAAADYITALRPQPESMGIAWGRTLTAVARAMPEDWAHGVDVYQTYGGLTRSNDDVVADSIGLMARRARGVGHMLPAPAIVSDVDLGRRLRNEPSVARTLAVAPRSDILVFSPGVLEEESVLVRSGFLTERGMERLRAMGAVTDIFSRFLDMSGEPVFQELEERTIAIPLDAVRQAKRSVAVASSLVKAVPMLVALRSRLATAAVVDEELAKEILLLGRLGAEGH